MSAEHPITNDEINFVAEHTWNLLDERKIKCCLFGSAACLGWGSTGRTPNDIDMVILSKDFESEQVKRLLVDADNSFFLVPSANPQNPYKVLWHKLPEQDNKQRRCKVDILIPGRVEEGGSLNIPRISLKLLAHDPTTQVPLMPLAALIFLKLQGWMDHANSRRRDFRQKSPVDVADIRALLTIAVDTYRLVLSVNDKTLPLWFTSKGRWRARKFAAKYPETAEQLASIGFIKRPQVQPQASAG